MTGFYATNLDMKAQAPTYTLLAPWNEKKDIFSNLNFLFTLFVSASLLISIKLCSWAIALLFVNWIWGKGYQGLGRIIKEQKEGFLLPTFFLLHVIGLLYSANLTYGGSDIERKLSLLLIPLVLLSRPLSSLQKDVSLAFFTCFALLLASIGLVRGLIHYDVIASTHGPEHLVTHFTDMHRVYFSIYLLFAYFATIYLFIKHKQHLPRLYKLLPYVAVISIALFIFIMASRMVMILFIASTIMLLFYFIVIQKKQYTIAIAVFAVVAIILGIVFTQVEYLHRFMHQLTEKLDAGQTEDMNSVNIRVVKYKCAIQGIEKHGLWGVGTGDIQDTLNHLYKINHFHKGYEVNMDAHNQYFQTTLAQGIPGLLLLLAFLFFNLRKGWKEQNYLLLALLLLFTLCSLSESLLTTQKGVVFLALFFPLLYYSSSRNTTLPL